MPATPLSGESEPEWLHNVDKNGQLFYLELSEGEEEAVAARSTLDQVSRRKRRESRNQGSAREDSMSSPSISKTQHKTVCVDVNPKRLGGSGELPLLEALLGVVHRPRRSDGAVVGRWGRLTVDGLTPGSPASKCGHILIGDVLVAVDDVDVNTENIEQVLARIVGLTQVRLTVTTSTSAGVPGRAAKAYVPIIPLGEDASEPKMSVSHIPHAIMYLSLKMDAESPQDEEEILYQYPPSEAATRLRAARGIFLTLCDMLDSVTGGHVVSSTLMLDEYLVHVGYWKEDDALLVLGLPAERVPLLCLQSVVGDAVRTLRLMYGSLARAFGRTEHSPQLDRFFGLLFLRLVRPSDSPWAPPPDISESIFLDGLPAVQWLSLPIQVKTDVDFLLTDFEASDFGELSEDFFGLRRLYGILGSCLFYESYLIANHLPKEDLLDVCLYMQHNDLLPVASRQRVSRLLIWREVFLQRPLSGRHFLLIVGLRCWMQCVLLEAGSRTAHRDASPGPDCVYVDQVTATLLRLENLEEVMEKCVSAAAPGLLCADRCLPTGVVRGRPGGLFGEKGRDWGGEGHTDAGSGSPAKILSGRQDTSDASGGILKAQWMKHSNPFDLGALMKTLSRRDTDDKSNATKLSAAAENFLFHYVLMETAQGIFIAPTPTEEAQHSRSIHPLLIGNFYRCCLSIRALFKENMPVQGQRAAERPRGLGAVKEHGVAFQCVAENWTEQKKPAPTLTYWVVGRLLLEPVPQEFYVCFHDSVSDLPVEMAFRLSFALAT
ncbi:protein inturned isoform X2 [Vanacampus margaritifer]